MTVLWKWEQTISVSYTHLVVSGEISSIYKQDGKVRKVHSLILLPDLEDAQRLSAKLEMIGNIEVYKRQSKCSDPG